MKRRNKKAQKREEIRRNKAEEISDKRIERGERACKTLRGIKMPYSSSVAFSDGRKDAWTPC